MSDMSTDNFKKYIRLEICQIFNVAGLTASAADSIVANTISFDVNRRPLA